MASSPRRGAGFCLAALLVLAAPATAGAHSISRSFSRWVFAGAQVQVEVTVPLMELARISPRLGRRGAVALIRDEAAASWVARYVLPRVRVADEGAACEETSRARLAPAGPARIIVRWRVACKRAPSPSVAVDLFFDGAPSHLHFVAARVGGAGHGSREALLVADQRKANLALASTAAPSRGGGGGLLTYLRVGVAHVLGGLDHVAFVLGLLLLGGRLWSVVKVATGFTLGHSVTLALAATGSVAPDTGSVEIMVGLSIAYVALEAYHHWFGPGVGRAFVVGLALCLHLFLLGLSLAGWTLLPWAVPVGSAIFCCCHLSLQARQGATVSLRIWVALLFGLIHGFAFAGALREIFTGAGLVLPLLGFNAGVELGQAAIILLALPLGRLSGRLLGPGRKQTLAAAGAAVILALGVSWTVTRALTYG